MTHNDVFIQTSEQDRAKGVLCYGIANIVRFERCRVTVACQQLRTRDCIDIEPLFCMQ